MSDAGSPAPEQKPKPEGESSCFIVYCCPDGRNTLNIKIVSTDGNEVFFKIKKTTKLNKLKNAYADRVGADVAAIRLLFDGQRIQEDQTAADLDLEEGDALDVLLEQVGGF